MHVGSRYPCVVTRDRIPYYNLEYCRYKKFVYHWFSGYTEMLRVRGLTRGLSCLDEIVNTLTNM